MFLRICEKLFYRLRHAIKDRCVSIIVRLSKVDADGVVGQGGNGMCRGQVMEDPKTVKVSVA